ncbi:hypothetical protein AURDEDRAFT_123481 [Auricularia subglabra TFB-10046 SS5]|nr:hypothetical protein AURDEDRAFT_123481 [Auricularia subglabra TFB-10046 SS5]
MSEQNIDPALFLATSPDGVLDADFLADNGPPSPFDQSMIDPALMALYPESDISMLSSHPPAAPPEPHARSPSPRDDTALPISKRKPTRRAAQNRRIWSEDDNASEPPVKKRARFAPLMPSSRKRARASPLPSKAPGNPLGGSPAAEPALLQPQPGASSSTTRALPSAAAGESSSKTRARLRQGTAKRTASDGTLVPPAPCARCAEKELDCLVKYAGAACNECRRRARKCSLVSKKGLTGFASVEYRCADRK